MIIAEFVVYDHDDGLVIIDADDEQSAELSCNQESVCLDVVDKFDSVIISRIRELNAVDSDGKKI